MTIAKVYGLKENPFEPTGAAVGKYPFVPPANFPVLEQKIEEAGIEKKFYALLVNSPHGAGKSTTMEYLKTKAINGGYLSFRAPVILTRLSNLSIQDFVEDVLEESRKYGRVKPLARSRYGQTTSKLRNILVGTLSPIAARSKLMLWIVDEFDILADRPKEGQQEFLQFLRGVMDGFARHDIPIAFIMSHTKYSSREFEGHLSDVHEPFRSRLVASVPLAYSFDEVKKIVFQRLKKASLSQRQESDLSPFSEQTLKSLYELILSVRGTESLDNFRVFERVCHFALIEGAKRGLKEIDSGLIKELFKEYGLKEIPVREGRRLAIKTSQEIATIKSESLMERNEAILRGIITGISRNAFFGEGALSVVQTSYLGQVGTTNVGISSLSFDLLHEGRTVNIRWVVASNKAEIIQEKDLEDVIEKATSQLEEEKLYAHIHLLSYVSSVEVLRVPSNPFDKVLWFPEGLAEDLIGLSVGVDEDSKALMESFDVEIAPLLSQTVTRETRDITVPLSKPAYEVTQTLYVMSIGGQSCTKETIRQRNKRLFMRRSTIQEKYVKEAIRSGFAREEVSQLKPSIPKAHMFLLELLKNGPQEQRQLLKKLGGVGEAIVESALTFGLVCKDGNQIVRHRLEDYEKEVSAIIRSLENAQENEVIKQSEPGKWIEWLLNAHDSAKRSERAYSRYIILSAIKELGPKIEDEVKKHLARTPHEVVTETVEPISQPPKIVRPETKPAELVETRSVIEKTSETIEVAILQIVQTTGAMSIQEIDTRMKKEGYEQDIKRTVFRLILEGRLKVIASG